MEPFLDNGTACPSLEEIAAYIDGYLSGAERDRVAAHLADCSECYEIYLGAVEFQLDEMPVAAAAVPADPPPTPVLPFPAYRKLIPQVAALAASLLLVIAAVSYFGSFTKPQWQTAELTAPLAGTPQLAASPWTRGIMRGGGDESLDPTAEFRAGVFLLDIHLGLEAGNRGDTLDTVSRMIDLLEDVTLGKVSHEKYIQLHTALDDERPRPLPEVQATSAEAEKELRSVFRDDSDLAFGQWAEAGRLAALAQNPEVFQARKYRKFLRWQLRHAEELDPEVQGALQQIQTILERENLQANDFSSLKTHFEAILEYYFRPQLSF